MVGGANSRLETKPVPARDAQRVQMNLVSTRTQRRRGWVVTCCRAGGTECSSECWDLLKEITIIFITSTIVWPQVNSREGTQRQSSTENWIKDLLTIALPIRTRPSFPLSQSHRARVQLLVIPWTVAYQVPPSMEFSRQEYWNAISFSKGSSRPRDQTQVSHIAGRCFTI